MDQNNEVLGGKSIEKEELSKSTKTDQGKPLDAYLKAASLPFKSSGRVSELSTPDVPTAAFQKRVGEFIPTGGRNLPEELAQDQSAGERWAYFLPRAAAKAVSSAASLPGYIEGMIDWAGNGFDPNTFSQAFDNGWITAVENAEQSIKDNLLPIYTPQSVVEGGLWKNLASSAFWAKEGADGVGFLVGMLAPGALTRLLKTGEVLQSSLKVLKPGFQLSAKLAGKIDDWTSVALNTGFEAATEAREAYTNALEKSGDRELAGKAAANTFNANLAILIGPNMLEQKWLFNAFNRGKTKVTDKTLGRIFGKEGEILESVKPLTRLQKATNISKTLGTGVLSEGFFEEGLQNVSSSLAVEGKNPLFDIEGTVKDYIANITGEDEESVDFWKSVVLGGILGGGMSTIGEIRSAKREEELTNEYHKLLKNNYVNRYTSVKDFAVIKDGKPVVNSNGSYEIDKEKLAKASQDQLNEMQMTEFMNILKSAGSEEAFEYFKNILDSRYIYPYVQVEGGLDLFKLHAEHMAKTESKQDLEEKGVSTNTVEEIKNKLIQKAEKLQQIYDDINDSNNITLRNSIKYDPKYNDVFNEFVNEVKGSKVSTKAAIEHRLERIEELRGRLSSGKAKVSSNEQKIGDALVASLKQSLEESKKLNSLDVQDVQLAEQQIKDIENHIAGYTNKTKTLSDLYSKSFNQKAFDKKIADKNKADEISSEREATKTAETKTSGLSPELEKVFNEGVKYETVDNIRTPEDLTIEPAINKTQVAHRGVLSIKTPTETVLVRVGRKTENNNLELQIVKQDESGNYIQSDTDKRLAYLNKDGTFVLGNSKFGVDFNNDIQVILTPEESRLSLQDRVMADIINNYITPLMTELSENQELLNFHRARVAKYKDALQNFLAKYQDTLTQEQIDLSKIRVGTEYKTVEQKISRRQKELVMLSEDIYITVAEAKEAVYESELIVRELEDSIPSKEARLNKIKDSLNSIRFDQLTPLESITKEIFALSDTIPLFRNDIITHKKEIARLRALLKKSVALIKGYNTTIASILGINLNRKEIDLNKHQFIITDKDGKQYEYTRVKTETGYKYTAREVGTDDVIRIKADHFDAAYDAYYINQSESIIDEESDLIARYLQENPNAIRERFVEENTKAYKGWFTIRPTDQQIDEFTTIKQTELDNLLDFRNKIATKIADLRKTISDEQSAIEEINKNRALSLDNQKKFVNLRNKFLSHYKKLIGNFFSVSDIIELDLYDKKLSEIGSIEDLLAKVFVDEDRNIIEFYEDNAKHLFKGDWRSFLFSTGNQEQSVDNPAIRRWYAFVNSEAYKTKEYGVVVVTKKSAKGVFKELLDNNDFFSDNDIKLVIVKKDTNVPVRMTDDGRIGTEGHLIHSSLPEKETIKVNGRDEIRFSFKYAVAKYLTDNKVSETEANEKVKEQFNKAFEEYKKFRQERLNSEEIKYLNIESVSAGAKAPVDPEVEVDVNDAFSRNPIGLTYVIETPDVDSEGNVVSKNVTRKISGSEGLVRAGFLYALYDNRHVLVKPKTLDATGAVDNIFNLYMYVANHLNTETKEGESAENIRAYLEKVLFHSIKKAPDYRLAFVYSVENGKKTNKIESLLFGNTLVKLSDLAKGKYNVELKEFLKNKYWSFDKKLVEATDRADFIEYIGSKTKGGKYTYSTVNHSVKQGGYKHFLFNPKTSKGVVNLKPAIKGTSEKSTALIMAEYENAQFLNQSLQLSEPLAEVVQKETRKVVTTATRNAPVVSEKPTAKFKLAKDTDELVKFTNEEGELYLVYDRADSKYRLLDQRDSVASLELGDNIATKVGWSDVISKAVKDSSGKIVVTSNKTTDQFSIEFIKQTKEEEIKETSKEESKNIPDLVLELKKLGRQKEINSNELLKLKNADKSIEGYSNTAKVSPTYIFLQKILSNVFNIKDIHPLDVTLLNSTKLRKETVDKLNIAYKLSFAAYEHNVNLPKGNEAKIGAKAIYDFQGAIADFIYNYVKDVYNIELNVSGTTFNAEEAHSTITEESEALTVWNTLDSTDIKEYFLEKANGDEIKAAELYAKNRNIKDVIPRIATSNDYVKEDLDAAIAWFKSKFPGFPIEDPIRGLLQGKYFGGLINGSKVLISDLAEEGTVYHEAFHVWSLLFKDDLTKLYNETRARLGNDKLTDMEVNEILAEEFRDFMLQGDSYHFNKITERTKESIFRKIWNYILRLLNLKEEAVENISEVEKAFSELKHGSFTKQLHTNTGTLYRIKNLSASESQALLEDMNARFFRLIMNDLLEFKGDIILKLDQKPELIYSLLRDSYKKRLEDNSVDWAADRILSNWDEFVDKHTLFLTQYKIDIRKRKKNSLNEEDMDEDNVLGRSSSEYVDSMSKDLKEEVPSSIRLLIGAIPNVVLNNEGKMEYIKGDFPTISNVQFGRMLNVINNKGAKSNTPDELFSNLAQLESRYPAIRILLRTIGFDIEAGSTTNVSGLTMTQFILRNQLFNSFANTKNIPIIGIKKIDDSIEYVYPTEEKEASVIRAEWKANGIALAESNKTPYIRYNKESGDYSINKTTLLKDIGDILSTKDASKLTRFFKNLGMDINPVTRYVEKDAYTNYIRRLSEALTPIEDVRLNDLYTGDIITNQKELNEVIKEHIESFFNDSDLTYINFNKDKEWSISRNSHLTEVVNRLNSYIRNKPSEVPENLNHIYNLYSKGSKVLENIEAGVGKEITVGVIKGIKDQNEDGKELREAEHPDYLVASFDSILNQNVPIIRAGDRGPESTLSLFNMNSGANEDLFIEDLFRYLRDEIRTSLALRLLNIGADIENYKTNALELRSFSFIHRLNRSLPTMEKFIKGKKAKNLADVEGLVDKYIKTHSEVLRSVFSDKLSEIKERNLNELLEWKLVIKNEEKENSYFVKGISTETLRNYKIDKDVDGSISGAALQKLLTIHAYNQYISTQEQLRLFFGDIAFYKDATDFHKRITSATSTRTLIANDKPTVDYLNENLPRLFNPHTQYINKVTFDTIIDTSDMYDGMEMKIADGQMLATLDFMRSLLARQGKWNEQEETYQYEMQKLMLEVKEDEELLSILGKSKDSIEELFKTGVFSKHTNNTIPSSPMYNGKIIDQYNLPQIPAVKNLGVGAIKGNPDLYPHYVNKMSVTGIFPSVLDRNKLKIFLSMLANDIDMFGDSTTEKVARVSGGPFGEITDKTPSQKVLYDDFGNQLDIQQEEKRKVTRSTQMDAVIFNDLFNNGQLLDKYKDLEGIINDHKAIIDALNKRDLATVIDDLGLKIVNDEYVLDDPEKFKAELTDAFVTRIMPDNVIDSIADFLDSATKTFDILVNKKEINSVLLSMVKNKTIKRKSPGEMLVQESPVMYEKLKGYTKGEPMEAIMTLPSAWQPWVKTLTYKSLTGLDALNELIKDEKLPKELYNVVANRIPTASINTIEAIRIKRFLPTYLGARIILPGDITIKASSDFDIDKLTTYFNNFKIRDNKQPQYIRYLTKENSTLKERYETFYSREEREDALANQVFDLFENLPSTERKILTIDEFSELPILEQNTKKALENRLNELMWEALLSKSRYEDLKRPHESKRLRKISEYIRKNKSKTKFDEIEESPEFDVLTEWWYNARKYREFQSSKRLVAFIASNNVVNSRSQKNPISIEEPLFTLFFEGHERGDEKYSSGFIKDDENELTADNFGQFLVAAVDAVKDPFIFEIMPNIDVYSLYSFLNKFGKGKGVGLKKIAKFLTHPIILDYLKEEAIRKSVMSDQGEMSKNTWKKYYGNPTDVLNRVLSKYGASVDDMPFRTYQDYLNSSLLEGKKEKGERYKEQIIGKKYKYLTLDDLSKTDNETALQIFDNFMTYKILAGAFINVNSVLRPDAHGSFPKSINGIENKLNNKELAIKSEIFGGVKEHLENSYIESSSNIFDETNKMFKWASYIRRNPGLRELTDDLKKDILSINHSWGRDIESVRNKIEDDLFLYAYLSSRFHTKTEQRKAYESFFKGKNSIPNRYIRLKEAGKINAELSKALRPVINEYVGHRHEYRENSYMSTFSKRYGVNEENALVSTIEEMLESKDTQVKQFAQDLLDFTLMQSGFSGSPISYTKLLPSSFVAKAMDDYIDKFFHNPNFMEAIKGFKEQFIRNRFSDPDVVAKVKGYMYDEASFHFKEREDGSRNPKYYRRVKRNAKTIEIDRFDTAWNSEYLTVKVLYGEKDYSKNKKKQKRSKYDILLLKDTGDITMKNPKYPKHVYKVIGKLGDQHRMLEYYTARGDQKVDSIINYNNQASDNQIEAKSSEFTWARKSENNYEVSTKGDKRFSAFNARLKNGKTIEYIYQVEIKGYKNIFDGKGKPPINKVSREDLWTAYLDLWKRWASENPELINELNNLAKGKVLTDMFANTDINQARALSIILNEFNPIEENNLNIEREALSIPVKQSTKKESNNYYTGDITPSENTIFVFGSNPEGRHGKGAAKVAVDKFGAKYGQGEGLQGNAYALPTKDLRVSKNQGLRSISREQIIKNIQTLYKTAKEHPNKHFKIAYRNTTEISLNGYTGLEMIEMFNAAGTIPSNIIFSKEWFDTGRLNLKTVNTESTNPEVKTDLNPTNVSEEIRNEYMKYVLDNIKNIKIYSGGSTEFTRQMSAALDWANIKTNIGSYTIEHSTGQFVVDFKAGSLSGLSIELFKLSDIKLLIGIGKLIETQGVSKVENTNRDQLSKVTNQLELSELIANFDKLFPNETWRSAEEKEAIMQSINRGDIEISCKI